MHTSLLKHSHLLSVLAYDADTGIFTWKVAASRRVAPGQQAGVVASNKRRYISILGEKHLAHRLAWFYVKGEWPQGNTTPIDGDYDNVSFTNIKVESAAETAQKGKMRSTNRSGYRGVSWSADKSKWLAVIGRDGLRVHLGYFDTAEAAAVAYDAAKGKMSGMVGSKTEWKGHRRLRHTMRMEWARIERLSGGKNPWPFFEVFLSAVPEAPSRDHRLVAADMTLPLGPENFEWRQEDLPKTSSRGQRAWRRRDLLRDFGLTVEQYDARSAAQGHACSICGRPETATRHGATKRLAVDHDHVTGALRDLLCSDCNTGIGKFADSPARLRAAAAYIERHRATDPKEEAA